MSNGIHPNPLTEPAKRIAAVTADYNADSGTVMTEERILQWVEHFPSEHRLPVLNETAHILAKTYISQKRMADFLGGVACNQELTKGDPRTFWAATELLQIQQRGASQREMVALLQNELAKLGIASCPHGQPGTQSFVYLDDTIFTGGHLLHDLTNWIKGSAPEIATVHVITAFIHTGATYRATNAKAKENLPGVAKGAGKKISFKCWRIAELEDRLWYSTNSDVLRPKAPPTDPVVQAYIASLQVELDAAKLKYKKEFTLRWREGDGIGQIGVFSSGAARAMIEEQLLIAGCEARRRCPFFIQSVRPLGYQYLTSLGFGGTVVTYRNCPNNCPLAWWAGDPWYPLFPRRTNAQTSTATIFGALEL
jgi:hypothetical protein